MCHLSFPYANKSLGAVQIISEEENLITLYKTTSTLTSVFH